MSETIKYLKTNLPVLAEGDLLVAGGSFGGVACALEAARAGLRVILVEPRSFLGREVTAALRPWLVLPEGDRTGSLPDLITGIIESSGVGEHPGGIIPLQIGILKRHLEDLLTGATVRVIYSSLPVDLFLQATRLAGVVIGNKSGRQVIQAPLVIDATETNLLARLAGMNPADVGETTAIYYRTLEFDRLGEIAAGPLQIPAELGIAGNAVNFVPGALGEGHGFIVCPLLLKRNVHDMAGWTLREIQARHKTMALAAYLLKNLPAFRKAYLAGASYQLDGPASGPLGRVHVSWGEMLVSYPLASVTEAPISVRDLAGNLPGLFILGDGILPDERSGAYLRDAVGAAQIGQALGRWVAHHASRLKEIRSQSGDEPSSGGEMAAGQKKSRLADEILVKEPSQPQRGRNYGSTSARQMPLPVMRNVEVLVVGGGTSGATAATISARNGARTLLVESNPGLGGTGTFGGVHSYWFGRRNGYSGEIIEAVEKKHAEMGMQPPEGALLKWNIEAKMHALLQRAEQAGVEVVWNSIVTGALMNGNRVVGAAVATPFGPAAILAKVVVDATGDGDVAVFAGADYQYGADRDHITMWYSLAQFYRPGVTNNNFTSMVDVGNVEDYTRAILAGRRRAEGHDAGIYIAPRESRHILADVILTLNDQLLKRCWPDTIYIAFSNHDVKGHTSSDWLRAGLIPPNLETEIPYRVLLPRGLDGILITGKAISATHDAQPAVRMQSDMENLGGVAGLAAALAVESRCLPRLVDVLELQKRLVADQVLPESILTRTLQSRPKGRQHLENLLQQIDPQKLLYTYQDMGLDVVYEGNIPIVELCCAGPQAVPVLESAMKNAEGGLRLMIARALSLVGSKAGVPDLIEAIHTETPDEGLQYRKSHIRHVNLPPDQGAAPNAVYLLYTLGMARDHRALPVWEHFAELVAETRPEDIRDRSLGLFYYTDAICYGAERLGDVRAVPLLKRMHANPMFHNQVARTGFETDYFLERQAYLEMVIARALARCGDQTGYEILADYLEDVRALLAEHAHTELVRLTGQDFGKNRQVWRDWLAKTATDRKPLPIMEPSEPVTAWNEEILTCTNEGENRAEQQMIRRK